MTTLKKDLILQFAAMTGLESMQNSRLMLLTPSGTIIGSIIPQDETEPAIASMQRVTNKLVKGFYEENRLPLNIPLEGNDGFFCLKNVTIQSSGATANLPFMIVFFDQIIAVSIIGNE